MRYPIFFSAIALFFCSCANKSKSNLEVFRIAEAGLRSSNESISNSNMMVFSEMESRSYDPQFRHTEFWLPVASQIHEISVGIGQYINALRNELYNEAGTSKKDEAAYYQEENTNAVAHIIKSKGKRLFYKLIDYRKDMLAVDSSLTNEFKNKILVFPDDFDFTKEDENAFVEKFFNDMPLAAAMVVLSRFENNIKINENNFTTYCLNQTFRGYHGYTRYEPLITQSSNYVKAGDELKIIAGIGSYSLECSPVIIINGKNIRINPEGAAVYQFKTKLKGGKYAVPVNLQYTLPDGRRESITRNIEYTVIDPNQNP